MDVVHTTNRASGRTRCSRREVGLGEELGRAGVHRARSHRVGSRNRLVSIWQFELIVSISPPVPSFSFEFDEALKFIDARMPLDRRIYKRVRLVSAE